MKKYFGLILSSILLLGTSVFATYEDFSKQLETMGLDVANIEKQESISRYDLARLLNIVECKDCIHPNQNMIDSYTQQFRATFRVTPGKDFNDIEYLGGINNNTSYYYCVAYVGDNTYMRGYPQATSPVCGGQFCGIKNTTTAEFLQVVINIIAKYINKDIYLNRKEVNNRLSSLQADSYEAKNFNSDDKQFIINKITTCDNSCALQNKAEVNLYLKYCMFNLKACDMQGIGKIKQGYRPVAELNLLSKQDTINLDQNLWKNTDKNIDGKTVLETLFKLNGKIQCTFNNDYDCDGLDNAKDSCPTKYNPQQKDTDKDGIGDTCDDDIDNDTIKNPVGIVDDEGKIDISKRTEQMDNCLFTINTNQEDISKNRIGDVCEDMGNQMGIYISMDKIEGIAPLTTTFSAITAGKVTKILRDFGDGTQGQGSPIVHTFIAPGMYNVQAVAQGNAPEVKAQTIIIVGGQVGSDKALQTRASMIGGKINTESTLSTSLIGTFDEIQWNFQNEGTVSIKAPNESFKKIFTTAGEHPIMVKGYRNGELAGVSYFTIGIEEGRGAILRSNSSNPEINTTVLFDTKTYNITQDDIIDVYRDFGDTTRKNNTALTMEYTYTTPGKKVVTQTITFTDGKKLTNIITINILDKTMFASYSLLMIPSKLIANIGEKIDFSTSIVGTMMEKPLMQILEFSDGISQKKEGDEKFPSQFIHSYQKSDVLTPQDSVHINACTYLRNQATISIQGVDMCLDAKIQGNLKNLYSCDLDGDGIPDICDSDIDNDGIPNLIGIINTENKNCTYESDPTQANANLNQEILTKHHQSICSLDNAPFNNNPDQLDLNQDGIGDIQDTTPVLKTESDALDSDGDGIIDNQDLCPTIQETRNGINDEDGCPEVGAEIGCEPTIAMTNDSFIVKPTTCNQCPCQFGDFADDLNNNDQVRAILRDKKKTIQYRFSLPWIVDL